MTPSRKRTSPLKVYGWTGFAHQRGRGQYRLIVAAQSFAAAQRAAVAAGLFKPSRDYYSTTGNEQELATALAAPGTVFARPLDDYRGEYVPLS